MQKFEKATEIEALGCRTLDALMSTETELHTMRVEFYPPRDSVSTAQSVRSIVITRESGITKETVQESDRSSVTIIDQKELEQVDWKTESKQVNGTVIGISIVLVVAAFAYIFLRQIYK